MKQLKEISQQDNYITDKTKDILNGVYEDLGVLFLDLSAIATGISATANNMKADDNVNLLDFLSQNLDERAKTLSDMQDVLSSFLNSAHNSKEDASKSLQGVTDIAGYLDDKMDDFEETAKYALDGSTTTVNGEVQPPSYDWRKLARLANEIAVAEDLEYSKED